MWKEIVKIFNSKQELGKAGEDVSCIYLEQMGYKIIERNFHCRQGEIDIIAKDKDEYVFIEIKTRSNIFFGRPKEAVNRPKQKHIYQSTRFYLYLHGLNSAFVRFDVIEVYFFNNRYKLKHLKQVEIKGTI